MDKTFEQARTLFLEGVARYEAGRLAEAEQKFAAALALVPGRASVLTNLGAVRLKLGRPADALEVLVEALTGDPGNAETLGHCATALAELGRLQDALLLFDRAVAADPASAALWTRRGTALRELGRVAEAAASYREALERGGDTELLRYYLAGLEAGAAPVRPPRDYVEGLFDAYAGDFEQHVQALGYDAPRVLLERVAASGRRLRHALDLGCGTGLCGPWLRPIAQRTTGVDLSAQMLQKARERGAYDTLVQADITDFLRTSFEQFDLVVAADVFIYVGALDPVFALLAPRIPAGGICAFTVEESEAEAMVLRGSLRYAHSEAEVRRLAQANGLRVEAIERRAVRREQQEAVAGLFVWLEKV